MVIEDAFTVAAGPDTVYEYLLHVDKVITCIPGAESLETVDDSALKARVKIKVGPISTTFEGEAQIVERDNAALTAKLRADGRELSGGGAAHALITMLVQPSENGSHVTITTDYTVVGRLAQFGRNVMQDIARRLTGQMADCIRGHLEAPDKRVANL